MIQEFWQPLKPELHFTYCDLCSSHQEKVNWMQSKSEAGMVYVRFLCDECYSQLNVSNSSLNQDASQEQKIEEDTPQWAKDFIQEQRKAGQLEEIGDTSKTTDASDTTKGLKSDDEITPAWTEKFIEEQRKSGKLQEIDHTISPPVFSETNKEEVEISDEVVKRDEDSNFTHVQVSSWSTGFIKESLFGADPISWLKEHGAFLPENHELSVKTLVALAHSQTGSVKISSIRALSEMLSTVKDEIANKIQSALKELYDEETDDIVKALISPFLK